MDEAFPAKTFESRHQPFYPGSYGVSQKSLQLDQKYSFSISLRIWHTLLTASPQTILAWGDVHLFIDDRGAVSVTLGEKTVSIDTVLPLRQWYQLKVTFNHAEKRITLRQSGPQAVHELDTVEASATVTFDHKQDAPVCLAARTAAGCQDNVATEHSMARSNRQKYTAHPTILIGN